MAFGAILGSPVQGELDFRLVYKPKRLRGCIPRPGMVFTPLFRVPLCKFRTEALRSVLGSPVQGELAKPQVLTEGLYPLTGYSVYTFRIYPFSFVTKRKAVKR